MGYGYSLERGAGLVDVLGTARGRTGHSLQPPERVVGEREPIAQRVIDGEIVPRVQERLDRGKGAGAGARER